MMKKTGLLMLCLILTLSASAALAEPLPWLRPWIDCARRIDEPKAREITCTMDADAVQAFLERAVPEDEMPAPYVSAVSALLSRLRLRVATAGRASRAQLLLGDDPVMDFTVRILDDGRTVWSSDLIPGFALDVSPLQKITPEQIAAAAGQLAAYEDYPFFQAGLDAVGMALETLADQGLADRYGDTLYYQGSPAPVLDLLTNGSLSPEQRTLELLQWIQSLAGPDFLAPDADFDAHNTFSITYSGASMGIMIVPCAVEETEIPDDDADADTPYVPDQYTTLYWDQEHAVLENRVSFGVAADGDGRAFGSQVLTIFALWDEGDALSFTGEGISDMTFGPVTTNERTSLSLLLQRNDEGQTLTAHLLRTHQEEQDGPDEIALPLLFSTQPNFSIQATLALPYDFSSPVLTVCEFDEEENAPLPPMITLSAAEMPPAEPGDIPVLGDCRLLTLEEAAKDEAFQDTLRTVTLPALQNIVLHRLPPEALPLLPILLMLLSYMQPAKP